MDTYRRLLPLFPHLESVSLTGYGEPLLNSNLLDMVRQARASLPERARVSFITNGSLITTDVAREIVASGIDELGISLEGCSAPTHDEIRRGSSFRDVLEKVALVTEARHGHSVGCAGTLVHPTPRLVVHFVAMKCNVAELPSVVRLAHGVGADGLIVSHLLAHTKDMKEETIYSHHSAEALHYFQRVRQHAEAEKLDLRRALDFVPYIYTLAGLPPLRDVRPPGSRWLKSVQQESRRVIQVVGRSIVEAAFEKIALDFAKLVKGEGMAWKEGEEVFAEASAEANRLGLDLWLPPVYPRAHRECGFIRNATAFISWEGSMRPCQNLSHAFTCYVNGRLKYINPVTFGNVGETSPEEIWDSSSYRRFRATTERFDFPPCGDCGFAEGCSLIRVPVFEKDCYFQRQPCGDCPWSRGILQC